MPNREFQEFALKALKKLDKLRSAPQSKPGADSKVSHVNQQSVALDREAIV